jgi:hypothetical protein
MMGSMQHFAHGDAGYLGWLSQHPGGFVINTYAKPSAAYLKLHRASCSTISRLQPRARTFTDGEYSKLCGERSELEEYASRLGASAQPAHSASDRVLLAA